MEKKYKLREVAEILGLKVRTIRQWVHDGKLEAVKAPGGKHWFVSDSELRRILGKDADKNREYSRRIKKS